MMEAIIHNLFSTEAGVVWLVLKWMLVVLAAGFIGQFGKALATYLMRRTRARQGNFSAGPARNARGGNPSRKDGAAGEALHGATLGGAAHQAEGRKETEEGAGQTAEKASEEAVQINRIGRTMGDKKITRRRVRCDHHRRGARGADGRSLHGKGELQDASCRIRHGHEPDHRDPSRGKLSRRSRHRRLRACGEVQGAGKKIRALDDLCLRRRPGEDSRSPGCRAGA